ncbi:MAG: VWA domain-containing protein [Salinibacter sp.]
MTFANPNLLWLLLLVPGIGAWTWWRAHRPDGIRYSDVGLTAGAPASWRVRLQGLPAVLRMGALALGIVALARPQVRDVIRTKTAEGIDIMLALDTSSSMRAEDFRPNRFEAAKAVASSFVEGRVSDRVGLIVFAAEAYTQVPLTLDYDFLQRMLERVSIGVVEDGTAVGTALATAVNRLKETEAESKVVVLLTDGRNNRGEIDPVTAAEIASTIGVRVYAIGVGAPPGQGAKSLPRDHPEERKPGEAGVDEQMLRTVASTTGGRYFSASSKEALQRIYDEIDAMEATEVDERVYTDREEWYAWFLGPAFALVCLEVLLATTVFRRFP